MPSETILGGISSEASLLDLIELQALLISQLTAKLPRTDAQGRLQVNINDNGNLVSLPNSTVIATLDRVSAFGASSRAADSVPYHIASIAAMSLYQNISFT